jgi:hypothetical protein
MLSLIFFQETPGGPFKLIEDGSFMDVDEQTNSNHASNVDGDDHQSNQLNSDTANSTNSNISSHSSSIVQRQNSGRVSFAFNDTMTLITMDDLINVEE